MTRLNVTELKKRVSSLWSESRKGQREAVDIIKAHYGYRALHWGMQYTHLAPVSEVTKYLSKELIDVPAGDDYMNDYLINKFKVNTSNAATPLLDISQGKISSRFIDVADLFDMIDNIESHDTTFINGQAATL